MASIESKSVVMVTVPKSEYILGQMALSYTRTIVCKPKEGRTCKYCPAGTCFRSKNQPEADAHISREKMAKTTRDAAKADKAVATALAAKAVADQAVAAAKAYSELTPTERTAADAADKEIRTKQAADRKADREARNAAKAKADAAFAAAGGGK